MGLRKVSVAVEDMQYGRMLVNTGLNEGAYSAILGDIEGLLQQVEVQSSGMIKAEPNHGL